MSETPVEDPITRLEAAVAAVSAQLIDVQGQVAAQQQMYVDLAEDVANNAALLGTLKQQIDACVSALVTGGFLAPLRDSSYVHEAMNNG